MTRKTIDINLVQDLIRHGARNAVANIQKNTKKMQAQVVAGETHHDKHPELKLTDLIKSREKDLLSLDPLQSFEFSEFMKACLSKNTKEIKILIDNGAPINDSFDIFGDDSNYHTFLVWSNMSSAEKRIVKELFYYHDRTPLAFAITQNYLPLLKTLIESNVAHKIRDKGHEIYSPSAHVLDWTAYNAFDEGFVYLIEEAGLAIPQDNEMQVELLRTAVNGRSLPLIKYLIEVGEIDPHATGERNQNWLSDVIVDNRKHLFTDNSGDDINCGKSTDILLYAMSLGIDLQRDATIAPKLIASFAPEIDGDGEKMGIEGIGSIFKQASAISDRSKTTHLGEAIHYALGTVQIICDDSDYTEAELEAKEIVAQDALLRLSILIEHGADPHCVDMNGNAPYKIINEVQNSNIFIYDFTDVNRIKNTIDLAYQKYVREHGAHKTEENNKFYIPADEQSLKH